MVGRVVLLCLLALGMHACASFGAADGIVPPTADQDPALSRAQIRVAGADRWIHFSAHGDKALPPLLVLHGSLSDHRALLPLRALSDRYHSCSGISEAVV